MDSELNLMIEMGMKKYEKFTMSHLHPGCYDTDGNHVVPIVERFGCDPDILYLYLRYLLKQKLYYSESIEKNNFKINELISMLDFHNELIEDIATTRHVNHKMNTDYRVNKLIDILKFNRNKQMEQYDEFENEISLVKEQFKLHYSANENATDLDGIFSDIFRMPLANDPIIKNSN